LLEKKNPLTEEDITGGKKKKAFRETFLLLTRRTGENSNQEPLGGPPEPRPGNRWVGTFLLGGRGKGATDEGSGQRCVGRARGNHLFSSRGGENKKAAGGPVLHAEGEERAFRKRGGTAWRKKLKAHRGREGAQVIAYLLPST